MGGKYSVKMSEDGAAVFDGDKVVASYNFGDTLVVNPKYRKRGIAEELVYQWRSRYPDVAKAKTRTKVSQNVQEKVWERIQNEKFRAENGF
jgi:GNAT superfamily N-acetyltransferase